MFSKRKVYGVRDTISLAGWLFADLLLGMSMLFLVFNTKGSVIELTSLSTSTPTPTSTVILRTITPVSTMTPTPSNDKTAIALGLRPALCYNLDLETRDVQKEREKIIKLLSKALPNDSKIRAGMILVWANGDGIGDGVRLASGIGTLIKEAFPLSFGDSEKKSLYFSTGGHNHIQLEIFFMTNSDWKSGLEVPCEYTK